VVLGTAGALAPAAAGFAAAFAFFTGISLKSSTAPPVSTTLSRSFTRVRKVTLSPSRHISVMSVSPGNTESAKRTRIDLNSRGSPPAKAPITCRAAKP
jgi:hypothetical protein